MSWAKYQNCVYGSMAMIGLAAAVLAVMHADKVGGDAVEQRAEVTRVLTMIIRDAPADPLNTAQGKHLVESAKLLVALNPEEPIMQLAEATQLYFAGEHRAAFPLYQQAADAGEAQSQFMLGTMYARGLGTTENESESLRWYTRAASAGNATACWQVGLRYEHGIGVEHDEQGAMLWYEKGVEGGSYRARQALTRLDVH